MNKIMVVSPFDMQIRKKYFRFYYTHRSFMLYVISTLFIILLFMALNVTLNATEKTSSSAIIMSWVMAGLVGVFMPLFLIGRVNSTINQQRKIIGKENEFMEFTYDKIVRSVHGQGKEVYPWNIFMRCYELEDAFFIFADAEAGLIVKKADIKTDGARETAVLALRKMIQTNIQKNRKGKPRYKICYKEKA